MTTSDPIDNPPPPAAWVRRDAYEHLRWSALRWRRLGRAFRIGYFVAVAWLFVVVLTTLAGCSTLRAPSSTESAWLALHAIDTAQTVTIAQSPRCLYEKDPFARMVYGTRHPSVSRVVATNVAMGVLHWQASAYLERHDAPAARWLFRTVSFLSSGYGVGNNLVVGVRPVGGNMCAKPAVSPYPLPVAGQ